MNIDLLVTHVDIENRSQLGNLTDTVPNWNLNQAAPEAITLREFHPTVDDRLVEDEEGFNDFGEGGMVIRERNPSTHNLFDDAIEDPRAIFTEIDMEDPRAVLMAQETRIDLEETEINQDLPDVDANAPPRNGGPQNDCRERSPPAFPE